jgi:hypothetical protein
MSDIGAQLGTVGTREIGTWERQGSASRVGSGLVDDLVRALTDTDDRSSSPLRSALFDTTDPAFIARTLGELVAESLAPISAVQFLRSGVGLVLGAILEDGRAVVVKIHRWNVTSDRLAAVQRVQQLLADEGLPAPRPLVEPLPLGSGIVTIEELRPGATADGHRPPVRESVAAGLAAFIDVASQIDPIPAVGQGSLTPSADDPLWGEPHDLRFDFEATSAGAEGIDEVADKARQELARASLADVVAHLDWRVENLGFSGHELTAIYDWDSVGLAPEPAAVGHAAGQFSTDWRIGHTTLPSIAEMRSFVRDYELHRGTQFDPDERAVLDAANLLLCAYGARCQHSDRTLFPEASGPPDTGWENLLLERQTHSLR